MNTRTSVKLFHIKPTGDPFNRFGWDISEQHHDGGGWWFRGDLSPIQGRDRTIRTLRSLYPGCRVRVGW